MRTVWIYWIDWNNEATRRQRISEALAYFGNTGFIDLPQRYLDVFNSCIRPFDSIPKDAVFLFATHNARKEMNYARFVKPYFGAICLR